MKIATIRLAVCNACSISLHYYVSVFVCVSTNKHQRPSCADFKASRKKHFVLVAEKVYQEPWFWVLEVIWRNGFMIYVVGTM